MWRTRAVLSLLHEEIAGLPRGDADDGAAGDGVAEDGVGDRWAEAMARARRRALTVVALDWLAILVLVLFGEHALLALSLGPAEGTVFTLAILAVATHAGFRLGQLEKLRAVARAGERVSRRDPDR